MAEDTDDAPDHHHHGHHHDRGPRAIVRYLRHAPEMWRSEINEAVVTELGVGSDDRALDIGAGMGAATVLAAARGAAVTAVEPTPFMRAVLHVRRLGQRARSRIHVVDGAAEHLPATDRSVDVVWATNTMHHWVDADRAVQEIARVLAPGGRVLLVDEDFDDPAHPDHDRFAGHGDSLEDHGFDTVDAEEMGQRLRAAGLVDVDTSRTELAGRPVIAVGAAASG